MPPVDEKSLNVKALKGLYAKLPVAKAALDYFSGRQYNPSATKVDLLEIRLRQQGHEFGRRDVIDFLQRLEETGAGRFVIGRRGQPSRFEWDVQAISAAKVAKGEQAAVAPLPPGTGSTDDDDETPAGVIRHPYRLRPDLTVTIDLPADLSEKEAARLAEFIKTLPFDETAEAA